MIASTIPSRDNLAKHTRFRDLTRPLGIGNNYELDVVNKEGYTSFVREVGAGRADVGFHRITLTEYRFRLADMISVQEMSQLVWLMARPKPRHDELLTTVRVFQWETWVAVLVSIACATLVFLVTYRKEKDGAFKAVVISYTGVMNEPVKYSWVSNVHGSTFVMLAFWIPLAFMINMFYKSQLLSNIVALEYDSTIDTSEQVLAAKLPLYIGRDTIYHETFTKNPTEILLKIFDENVLKYGGIVASDEDAVKTRKPLLDKGEAVALELWEEHFKERQLHF